MKNFFSVLAVSLLFVFQASAAVDISLTLGQKNYSVPVPRTGIDSRLEISSEALKQADPLALVNLNVAGSEANAFTVQASAAYSAPSFAPVKLVAKEIDNLTNQVLAETELSVEVRAEVVIRLLGDTEDEVSIFDAPMEISLQPHAGGVKLVFIDEDPREGINHRIHGSEPIKHASMEEMLTKQGDKYEWLVTETKETEGEFRCHEHNDYDAVHVIKFNVKDEGVLRNAQFTQ